MTATPIRLFVYGTLMSGERSDNYLSDCEFVATAQTVAAFTLVTVGWFPAMLADGDTSVVGEVWHVPPHQIAALDRYEGVPHMFLRKSIALADGSWAQAYVAAAGVLAADRTTIESGDWRVHNANER